MPYRTDVNYLYDGSFQGLLTCVFESFTRRELPERIESRPSDQMSLLDTHVVETDREKAARVLNSIPEKIGPRALRLVYHAYLSCLADKERQILDFLRLGYQKGSQALSMLAYPCVLALCKAERALLQEADHYRGFVRFSDYGGILVAIIRPKNSVLPKLKRHFCDRFSQERFLIWDKTHGLCLIHGQHRSEIFPCFDFRPPAPEERERYFRNLWRGFYNSTGITQRENLRCRMSHMPKRFWDQLPELFQPEPASVSAAPHAKELTK